MLPIHPRLRAEGLTDKARHVYVAQAAVPIRLQRDLTAWVGRDHAHAIVLGGGPVLDLIPEDQTRLGVVPGSFDQLVPQFAGRDGPAQRGALAAELEGKSAVRLHRPHEPVRHAYADVG